MKLALIVSTILFGLYCGIVTVKRIQFNQNCGGHLTLAANSNTIELATKELETAVNYLALKELKEISPDATPLEKSNVLMKLRESITEHGESGESLNVPTGIALYPNNTLFAIFGLIAFIPFAGCILIASVK